MVIIYVVGRVSTGGSSSCVRGAKAPSHAKPNMDGSWIPVEEIRNIYLNPFYNYNFKYTKSYINNLFLIKKLLIL